MMKTIEFFYDIVCPYAYLATMQLEEVAQRCAVNISWRPVLLGGIYKSIETPQQPSSQWPEAKKQWNILDLQRQIQKANIDFQFHPKHPQRTVEVMRLLAICPEHLRPTLSKRLYRAYWVENIKFPNDAFLSQLAIEYGLPDNCYKTDEAKKCLYEHTEYAVQKGAFGVPTILFEDHLIWGQDRLFFLEEYFSVKQNQWPSGNHGGSLRFYHDFASPFSFLAAMVIEDLAKHCNVTIEYHPILLGGLFRSIGTPMVPVFTMSKNKRYHVGVDLKRWAKWWDTEFNWPKVFPMRSILPLRVALVLPELTQAIYQAYWIRGEDISRPEVLAPLIKELGHQPDDIFEQAQSNQIKTRLKENTSSAQGEKVCGVPSFQIDDQLWWGQDRLLDLAEYLSQN